MKKLLFLLFGFVLVLSLATPMIAQEAAGGGQATAPKAEKKEKKAKKEKKEKKETKEAPKEAPK